MVLFISPQNFYKFLEMHPTSSFIWKILGSQISFFLSVSVTNATLDLSNCSVAYNY